MNALIETLRKLTARARLGYVHKSNITRTKDGRRLAGASRTFKSADGRTYRYEVNGQLTRVSPVKPWANKAERKVVLRERREDRALATLNLASLNT